MKRWKKFCTIFTFAAILLLQNALAESLESANQLRAQVEKVDIGGYVTFGAYPQTAAGNDKTPIEWLVLDRDGDKALLLSRYGLDAQPYSWDFTGVTWETCTLRGWLNDDFMNRAFTAEEQSTILLTNVDNSDGQGYDQWSRYTSSGNDTQDKIFLLSYAEANQYLGVSCDEDSKSIQSCIAPTAYAITRGAYQSDAYKTIDDEYAGKYWLRSPGYIQNCAANVSSDGSLDCYYYVSYVDCCVRPALWVDICSVSNESDVSDVSSATVQSEATEKPIYDTFEASSFLYDTYIWNECLLFAKNEQAVSINGIYGEYDFPDTCELELPSSISGLPVVQIGENAFWNSKDIVRIVVPSSVQIIRSGSFDKMEVLTEVILEEGTMIIEDTFNQCPKLFNVTIPSSVTSISDSAFDADNPYFHLTVEKGSYAEKYAEEHSIPYVYTKVRKKLDLAPGNTVSFGKRGEEWLVLKVEEDEALLLSKDVLLTKSYSTNGHALWASSEINRYLNDMLLYDLFSMEEASLVTAHRIYDPASPYSLLGYPGDSDVCHLFLLSYYEARDLIPTNGQRATMKDWWLRTSRDYTDNTHYVSANGNIMEGKHITDVSGVRPALWIRTDNAAGIIDLVDDNVWSEKQEIDDGVLSVGDVIQLGRYEQDNDPSNGSEPISWIVLDVDGKEATLISKYCIDVHPYHDTQTAVSWADSSLNRWLNRDFLNAAFTEEEQKYLIRTLLDDYSGYDKIWILDLDEANYYLPSQEDKLAKVTKYATTRGAAKSTESYGTWLLRTYKNRQKRANIILPYTGDMSVDITRTDTSIRPVIKVDLAALGITCNILSPANGSVLECYKDVLVEWNSMKGAEAYSVSVFSIGENGEEFIWGDQVQANESNCVLIPAGTLTASDYSIEVRAWASSADHDDHVISMDRVEITAIKGIISPVDGDTVPVGQKLQLEWSAIPGATCYSIDVYPTSSINAPEWYAHLNNGELSVEIPRSTLIEPSYQIELSAWKDVVYGEEVFSQTITVNTYNKYEEHSEQAAEKDLDTDAVHTSGEYSYRLLEDGTIAFVDFSGRGPLGIPETIDGYTVTAIADGACYWNSALTMVSIPGTVKTIGANAFSWCMSMEQVDIEEGVTRIGDSAFSNNSGLKWINFADSITHMGEYVCSDCPCIGDIVLPAQLVFIGEGAFSSCESLWGIKIPAGVRSVPSSAFFCCTDLGSVYLPEGLTDIGDFAFYGCEALSSVVIPSTVETIGEWAFSYCTNLSSLTISDAVQLGEGAFSECSL